MDFMPRLLLCGLMMLVAFCGLYANRARRRAPGTSLFAFVLDADNFTDWGKLWRIVALVSVLAIAGVVTMKMVAMVLGGPILDLDQYG